MTKQLRQAYEAPTTETLELRFEGEILTISGGEPGSAGNDLIKGNSWGFGEDD